MATSRPSASTTPTTTAPWCPAPRTRTPSSSALAGLARPAPRTEFQTAYNDQLANIFDVTDNALIDAPSVEHGPRRTRRAGVDPTLDTVVLINWYGRPDLRFHVYTKTGEPDPDTGFDFGASLDTRKLVAWGGTANADEETGRGGGQPQARLWFFDLSAGPESWAGSFNVDDADLDGDGAADYRLPPAWEYAEAGIARRRS